MGVRLAQISDAEKIARNNVMLAEESEGALLEYEKAVKGVLAVINDKKKGFYVVAEESGTIAGQLMITYEWSDWRNENTWWLQSIYVKKEMRRRGVMGVLLDYVKNIACRENIQTIKLYVHENNKNAINAYNKKGMKKAPYFMYYMGLTD